MALKKSDSLVDFYVNPSLFPVSPEDFVQDLWMQDYFDDDLLNFDVAADATGADVRTADVIEPEAGMKRKHVIADNTEEPPIKVEIKEEEKDDRPIPRLNPKLASFFSDMLNLYNGGNTEEIAVLLQSVCDEDIALKICTPGVVREETGLEKIIDMYRSIFTIFPDAVRREGNLKLAQDREGIYFSTNFQFTGTRAIKTKKDKDIIGDTGLIGMMEAQDLTPDRLEILKQLDEAERVHGQRVLVSAIGIRKCYINIETNKYCKYFCKWKISDITASNGQTISFFPSTTS